MSGTFMVSLDFELFWGMLEVCSLESYQDHVLGGKKAIPQMLRLFEKYGIHATWATVGFLFADNYEEATRFFPDLRPSYRNPELNCPLFLCARSAGTDCSDAGTGNRQPHLLPLLLPGSGPDGSAVRSGYACCQRHCSQQRLQGYLCDSAQKSERTGIYGSSSENRIHRLSGGRSGLDSQIFPEMEVSAPLSSAASAGHVSASDGAVLLYPQTGKRYLEPGGIPDFPPHLPATGIPGGHEAATDQAGNALCGQTRTAVPSLVAPS